MKPFLYSVAQAYASHYDDLSGVCFIFPNKRSGSFFTKYLASVSRDIIIAPVVTTISDFVADLSGREVDSHLDLVFRLYECYRGLAPSDVSGYLRRENDKSDFEKFRSWGETVLSDFDEIDMQLVEVDELLKNVSDYKSISSTFLTEEQKRVMQQYFGYTGSFDSPDNFWRNFDTLAEKEGLSEIKSKFLYLWQVMKPLYYALNESLAKDGLSTRGGSYRLAYQSLNTLVRGGAANPSDHDFLKRYDKVVFIGFNALSRAEHRIMMLLKRMKCRFNAGSEPYADFYWDATDPLLDDPENPASRFVLANRSFFPSPEWALPYISQSDTHALPEVINVDASPSNAAQVKIIGERLQMLLEGIGDREKIAAYLRKAKVAIVLPDENLLQPLLYSLPEDVENPNLTMGYPLKQTVVVSFIALLRRLHARQRKGSDGTPGFYYDDLRLFLAHPFSQALFGSSKIGKFNTTLANMHVFSVTKEQIKRLGETAVTMLTPLSPSISPVATVDYLLNVLGIADSAMKGNTGFMLKGKLERQHIATYADALRQLGDALKRYDVDMHYTTVFSLAERLIGALSVSFEGEPLEGLQVMGMLETRALDFDYLFIPSMNDKIMPRRARMRTFIPNVIRRAYGMPPANYQESIFAYYFFRLLSRAKGVWLTYDSRTGDGGGGGISRYLLQLKHLSAPQKITFTDFSFIPSSCPPKDDVVEKSGRIADKIGEFLNPETKTNMSASAFNLYTSCPMRFFYERVLGLRTDMEPTESIDAATMGNIVHAAMMHIYLPENKHRKFLTSPEEITSDYIHTRLADTKGLRRLVHRIINKEHFHLPDDQLDSALKGSARYTLDGLVEMVKNVLKYDASIAPFRLYGCEVSGREEFPMSDGRKINMKYSIDRIDRLGTSPEAPFRIVDYKTGKEHLVAKDIDEIFAGSASSKHIAQLYVYAALFEHMASEKIPEISDILGKGIVLEIYPVAKIFDKKVDRYPKIAKEKQILHTAYKDEFNERFDKCLMELFDVSIPFVRTSDISHCTYCALANICGR